MANLRDLKKEIKLICGDIASECLIARNFIPGVDMKTLDDVIVKVAELQTKALSNLSFNFDRQPYDFESGREYHKARSSYYKKAYSSLKTKFLSHVNDLVHELNNALPKRAAELRGSIQA